MISTASSKRYSLKSIQEEAHSLVEIGLITVDQPLRILFEYMPAKQWHRIEWELEKNDFLLRDRIIDLIGKLEWEDD
ncbi:hypothetical protein NIES4102_33370 [Chondrocystis sp. NIES-4102]|nr:hypothetical protein NIES4102_33370 [Chondrocystis sp. NIES-4102]